MRSAHRETEGSTGMGVIKQIREALEEAAEVLDPARADPRAVIPEVTGASLSDAPGRRRRKPPTGSAEVRPSAKSLGKEHRGF